MDMQTSNRLEGIGEYYFSQKLREIDQLNKDGKQIINLGIGSPDLAPHPDVIKVLQETSAADNVHAYQSYKGSPILRNAISEFYHYNHYNYLIFIYLVFLFSISLKSQQNNCKLAEYLVR